MHQRRERDNPPSLRRTETQDRRPSARIATCWPLKRRHRQCQPAQHKSHAAVRRERPEQFHTGQVPQFDIEAKTKNTGHKACRRQATAPVETAFSCHPRCNQQGQRMKLLHLQSRLQGTRSGFVQTGLVRHQGRGQYRQSPCHTGENKHPHASDFHEQ